MEYLLQKVAYLNGLAEGLRIDEKSAEGKLMLEIIDTLDEMAEAISYLDDNQALIQEDLDFLEDDLTELEYLAYQLDDDEDYLDYDPEEIDFFDLEDDDFRNIPPGFFDLDIFDAEEDEEEEMEELEELENSEE